MLPALLQQLIQKTGKKGEYFDPEFKPELTPKEMLEMGVFGGKYLADCQDEFPKDWFEKAKISYKKQDHSLNYFGVNASLSRGSWEKKEWRHPLDPRGWFQWYCRYYMGRRCPDDERQIYNWKNIKRHIAGIKKHCEPRDLECRKKQRQALLHWAYDSRKI